MIPSFTFFVLLAIAFCPQPSSQPDAMVKAFMKQNEVPGVFVAVVRGDSVLYQNSFGVADKERGTPLTAATCMELGSISKAFTAQVIYDLYGKGQLHISDPITKYFPKAPAAWSGIRIAHLLSHTSGLQNYLQDPRFRAADYFTNAPDKAAESFFRKVSTDSMVRMFYSLPLEFAPGSSWAYSNTGYYLLGKIAEAATGKSAFEQVRETVTGPLDMQHTVANEQAAKEGCLAKGYFRKADGLHPSRVLTSTYAYTAGAWATTGNDMIAYLKAVHRKALPSDRTGYDRRRRTTDSDLPFTYEGGRFYTTFHGRQVVSHNGGTPGFSSSWIYVPDKNISIIVLINRQDYAPIDHLAWDLLALYEPALQYPSERIKGAEAEAPTTLVKDVVKAIEKGTPVPEKITSPLKVFLQSDNGKGLWKWYFERGFPGSIYCVDGEAIGTTKAWRFRGPLNDSVEYRLTALVNEEGQLVQLRWW